MKILIVDDEKLARERLKDLIYEDDTSHCILDADNGLSAIQIVENEQPDVLLLDIRMPIMDGLETAYHLATLDHPPCVIFTTAYQDHAIDAFEANAVDYLLKPIRRERLQQALSRAQFINQARLTELRDNVIKKKSRSHLSVINQGRIELIPVTEIRYLKAEQKYVTIGWSGRESLIDESLMHLELEFPQVFLRIHRNALVAYNFIEALEKDGDGNFQIKLKGVPKCLSISRRHLHDVRKTIKNIN